MKGTRVRREEAKDATRG